MLSFRVNWRATMLYNHGRPQLTEHTACVTRPAALGSNVQKGETMRERPEASIKCRVCKRKHSEEETNYGTFKCTCDGVIEADQRSHYI